MKQWKCNVCGYIHKGENPPEACPICGVGAELFELVVTSDAQAAQTGNKKKWRCTVCNYVHYGDVPPDSCPECGVGPELFVEVEEEAKKPIAVKSAKRWRCMVCNYVHYGDAPPDSCPECGVGPEQFEELVEQARPSKGTEGGTTVTAISAVSQYNPDYALIQQVMFKVTYGLYIVTSRVENRINAQCCNTLVQLTTDPPRISICLHRDTLTHEFIMQSKVFTACILGEDHNDMVRQFGFKSGREADKFQGVDYEWGDTGCPILKRSAAFVEGVVLPDKIVDVGTHTIFVADIVNAGIVDPSQGLLTYQHYRQAKK